MRRLGYRPALDGVRCLAILPVVGLHAFGWPRQGSLGVDVFFVLSGFLITTVLLIEGEQRGSVSLRRFYRRRAMRLLPAVFTMLTAFLVATIISLSMAGNLDRAHLSHPLLGIAAALSYTANFAGAAGFHPAGIGHLWSLAEEEQFYLLWPPLLFIVLRARKEVALRILAVAIAAVAVERMAIAISAEQIPLYRLYNAPDTHADPILIGCFAAVALASGRLPNSLKDERRRKRLAMACAVGIGLGIAFLDRVWPLLYLTPLLTAFSAACAVMIISAAMDDGLLTHLLSFRPIAFIGRISYSLYLWHAPVLLFIAGWAGVVASLMIATASYFLVEEPFRRGASWRRWRRVSEAPTLAQVGSGAAPL
jgi:peptidoglycan/LPS O-acetylase OafA/YrhL